jgi:bidirectional [NiFe] hydrogenase diaphorase subunit
MISFTINDRELQVPDGTTILEAALEAGIRIPTLCFHKELTPGGTCRVCMVEIVRGGRPGLTAACLYKVTPGLVVQTDTEQVKATRKIIIELLMAKSPGSKVLTDMAEEFGIKGTRITLKNTEQCYLCGLCVRACSEISQRKSIAFAYRGKRRTIQTAFGEVSKTCIGCGACAYLCPTGRIKIEEIQ